MSRGLSPVAKVAINPEKAPSVINIAKSVWSRPEMWPSNSALRVRYSSNRKFKLLIMRGFLGTFVSRYSCDI